MLDIFCRCIILILSWNMMPSLKDLMTRLCLWCRHQNTLNSIIVKPMKIVNELIDKAKIFLDGNERSVAVKKNIVYSILIRIISIVISFLIVPVTIGYVSAELYGVWLTLSSIMAWLSFMDIGFTQGLKNRLAEAIANDEWERGKELVSTTYFMMMVIFIPAAIIIIWLVSFIDWCGLLNVERIYESEINKVMIVVIGFACLQMIVNVIVSVVAAFQKVALSNSFGVIGNVLSLFVIIVLTKTCPPSLIYLSIAFCSLPVIVTLVASFLLFSNSFKCVAPSFSRIKLPLVKDLFGLGYKFFIINIQALILYQSTNFLISYVSSPLMVTSYNLAYRYMNLAMMFFTIITAPLWPAYTDAFAKEDYDWMINTRVRMQEVFRASMILAIIMVALSPVFYRLWVGDKADVPFMMTLFVSAYVIVFCWLNLNGTLVVGMGKLKVQTLMCVVGMFIHIPLSIILSRAIGAYGVLASLALITLVYAIVINFQANIILEKKAIGIWME